MTPARTPRSTPRSVRRCPPMPCWPGTARRSPTSARCTSSTSRRRADLHTPGFATLGYGLPAGLGRVDRAARRTGGGAARRRGTDVLRAGTGRPCGATAFGAGDRRGQRRLSRNPRPAGRAEHPADRRRAAHPDLAALAVAMGAHGVRTTSSADLPELIAGALDAAGPTLYPSRYPLKGPRHHGHRRRRHLHHRHDRLRLLGQTPRHHRIRLPGRGAPARPGPVLGHHGRHRARRRIHHRRCRARLPVRHLRHVAGGRDRRAAFWP